MASFSDEKYHPGLSVDCVIFGFNSNVLKVLLLKLKGTDTWALPGGFVKSSENVDDAAIRVLRERTGLEDIFLRQFQLFGSLERHDRAHTEKMIEKGIINKADIPWFNQRFVTLGYYALVEYSKVNEPTADYISEFCQWYPIDEVPELMLDHSQILARAYEELKEQVSNHPVGLNLMPAQFTMPELQSLYETILGKSLDRRNFQRKMLSYGILRKTGKRQNGKAHKAPWLYEFDEENYASALQADNYRGI
ncbi:NUDIX hydrolase [Fulvivirga sedimenti]|uniref:NUDIX domain-containing protein n=1 Tax=Fulvivirga sedimenti TaxID=2879465 RepID=A0A9X1HXD4_9BACT|nr:NUDIX domain-containing protein [Fulvivirga sedimenti]MCA6079090.1 NUDIX domain-containing protein [Fulvivirga sedimenti]